MNNMEIQPITIDAIMTWLERSAAEQRKPIILDARIVISRDETRLLSATVARPLEVIRY